MDPRGLLEMLLIFLEERGGVVDAPPSLVDSEVSPMKHHYK